MHLEFAINLVQTELYFQLVIGKNYMIGYLFDAFVKGLIVQALTDR